MRVFNGGSKGQNILVCTIFLTTSRKQWYFCTILFNRCLWCDVPLFSEVGGKVLGGKMFVCKNSHFCEFLKQGEKASFLSTISCSFSIISKYIRMQPAFTWEHTSLKRKILLFSPSSVPDHQKMRMNYLNLFCLLSRSSDNNIGIASAPECTSSVTHLWKLSISFAVPAGSLQNSKFNPNKTSSNSNLLF